MARFEQGALNRNRPGLQVLDFLKKQVDLDAELKNAPQKFSITNLERIIQDPDVRKDLGLTIESGHVHSEFPSEETTKCLLRIVRDLVSGEFSVKDVYYKADRKKYIEGLGGDRPDPAKRLEKKTPSRGVALQAALDDGNCSSSSAARAPGLAAI